jgi:small subunit ribosomal protein S8
MSMTDPIADMLTRIRNGIQSRHDRVEMPVSKLKVEVAKILKSEGFITNYKVQPPEDGKPQGSLRVYLKYAENGEPVIHGIERVSRPGRRVYRGKEDIPKVLGGLGLAIVSTSKGVLSGAEAMKTGVGGEVLCQVW